MSEPFLAGLDLGGGGGRCLLIGLESGRIASARRPWRPCPDPANPLASDLDVEGVWSLLGEATREALARAGASASDVVGIAAAGMRHGSVLLDAAGRELFATSNRDARGVGASLELAALHGEALARDTGHWPNPVQALGRLRWVAAEAPALLERAARHLSIGDWIGFRLTGEAAAEPSQAVETGLFQLAERDWAWDWIERLGLPRELFPPVRDAGTPLGALTPAAAAALGLAAGLPVAVGGADTQCGLLGAGVVAPGQLGAVAGTTAPVLRVLAGPPPNPDARLWAVHHAVPKRWALESNAGAMGDGLRWIAGLLHPGCAHAELRLLDEAARSEPGATGVRASVGAQVMDARQLALPVSSVAFTHLAAGDDPERRRHLARAVVEGMAYALRANAEQIAAATGLGPAPLHLGGGLSRSALFAQIASDVMAAPVRVAACHETSALGAALCAGVGAGRLSDLEEAAERLAPARAGFEPDARRSALYAGLYAEWQELRAARQGHDLRAGPMFLRQLGAPPEARPATASPFRPRILVTADLDAGGLAALRALGEVEHRSYRSAMRVLSGRALAEALAGVHVLVTEVDVVDAEALAGAPDLRAVAVCRGDAVNVDLAAATALGIPVVNTPGRNADAVAELTVAFLLMLSRKLPEAAAFLREPGGVGGDLGRMGRAFSRLRGHELWGRTVGLVGMGAVGREVARRLRPFEVRCLGFDPHQPPDALRLAGAEPVGLGELLEQSDFVSLHAAVADASRGLIGRAELARMRPGSFLVNTARAALVDEAALLEALHSGRLAGAALDVFAEEPPASDHPLLALPQVIATPHVGGNTHEVSAHQGRIVAEALECMRRGERPAHLRNPEAWGRFDWAEPRPAPDPALAARLGRGPRPAVTDLEARRARAPEPSAVRDAPQVPERSGGARSEPQASGVRDASQVPERSGGARSEPQASGVSDAPLEHLLAAFVERVGADEALRAFAREGEEAVIHFRILDRGTGFHVGFAGGRVWGALGAPEGEATLELAMKADLFDGMMTGRRNAMQAAMQGELSFRGDTARAMGLNRVQRDLGRLYAAVRAELGPPGDLTPPQAEERGEADTPASAEAERRRAQRAAGERSSARTDERDELVSIVRELYAAELITATGGNVSARCEDDPENAWITPSQLFKGDLSREILVRIDMAGKTLDPEARRPSSEALMHTAVLRARPEVRAVVHCHAPYATILANAELPFLPISTEAAFLVDIGRIPFVMPGSQQLADAVVEAMGEGWAVLMQNHGLLVAGRSLRRAADMCEIVERTAQVIVGCRSVGREPPVLPDDVVKMLARFGDLMA